ncbi:hypothetical protein HY086_05475 [Candidatus Gottesmanbacteria bacterium]|nr:hypothetical protein [Candidatus Gottesmanbacteria bacterium]
MDPVQLTIVAISFILTFLFVFLGIQVWFILKEMKIGLQKMNKMLDDMGKVTGTVGETATGMSGLLSGLKAGLSLFSGLHKKGDDDE